MVTSDAISGEFCILPVACSDLLGLAELPLNLPKEAQLFIDAGYNFYEWEDYLLETKQLRLQVRRKANSKTRGANRGWKSINRLSENLSKQRLEKFLLFSFRECSCSIR